MIQVIKQTYKEKVTMYMKMPKKELIMMLIASNTALDTICASQTPLEFKTMLNTTTFSNVN